jgi:Raf kinase inhibitor-like YbhB/YbcL family protein
MFQNTYEGMVCGTIGLSLTSLQPYVISKRESLDYYGPCPPDREHRYFFKLYALDAELDLPEKATKHQVEGAMEGHVIAKAELMGKYERV